MKIFIHMNDKLTNWMKMKINENLKNLGWMKHSNYMEYSNYR